MRLDKFEDADFKCDNSSYKILAQKYQKKGIFGPKFRHFYFFAKKLQLENFEDVDFKCDNSSCKILAQKYPSKAFVVPNLGIFIFSRNEKLEKLEKFEVLISNMTTLFSTIVFF